MGRKRRSRRPSASRKSSDLEVRYKLEQPEEGAHTGCVMLSEVRYRFRKRGTGVPMRCSLGYALRTDEEVCRCYSVSGPSECWKDQPSWRVSELEPDVEASADEATKRSMNGRKSNEDVPIEEIQSVQQVERWSAE